MTQPAERAGLHESTLRKGLERRVVRRLETGAASPAEGGRTKSERSRLDAQAAACTRAEERVAAATGLTDGSVARF